MTKVGQNQVNFFSVCDSVISVRNKCVKKNNYIVFSVCHVLFCIFIFTTNLTEDATIIRIIEIAILQLRKQKHREAKENAQSHTAVEF